MDDGVVTFDLSLPEGGPVSAMDLDEYILATRPTKRELDETRQEMDPITEDDLAAISGEPLPFEYEPSLAEQGLEYLTTPEAVPLVASIVSANPAWLIPDIGDTFHSATSYLRNNFDTMRNLLPETGSPWEAISNLVNGDWQYLLMDKSKDMARNPEDYPE